MADFLTGLLDRAFDRAPMVQPPRAPLFAPARNDSRVEAFGAPFDLLNPFSQESPVQEDDDVSKASPSAHTIASRLVTSPRRAPQHGSADAPAREADDALLPSAVHPLLLSQRRADGSPNRLDEPTVREPNVVDWPAPDEHKEGVQAFDTLHVADRNAVDEEDLLRKMLARLPQPQPLDGHDASSHEARNPSLPLAVEPARHVAASFAPMPIIALHERESAHQPQAKPAVVDADDAPRPTPQPRAIAHVVPHIAVAPQPQAARASPTPTPSPTSETSQSPVIHVSIGRIEVRATPPQPQPARRLTHQPTLTLDEYLRQRHGSNGGSR